jgi:hypothetical protein
MTLTTVYSDGNISISFLTQTGYDHQLEFKTNLTDVVWSPLGNLTAGDGTVHSVNKGMVGSICFYRVRVQ